MPMIDVYAVAGTFRDKHTLAKDLANAVMRWEKVPRLALFKNNTAAFGSFTSCRATHCPTLQATATTFACRCSPPSGSWTATSSSAWCESSRTSSRRRPAIRR